MASSFTTPGQHELRSGGNCARFESALLALALLLTGCTSGDSPTTSAGRGDSVGVSTSGLDISRPGWVEASATFGPAVQAAAADQARRFLDAIPESLEQQHGFADRAEHALATVGRAYPVYTVSPATPALELETTNTWRLPVLVRGQHRSMLTVAGTGRKLRVVEIGAAALASQLGDLEQRLGNPNGPRALLRVFQLGADFVLVAGGNEATAWPLPSAVHGLGLPSSQPISLEQLRGLLRNKLADVRQQTGAR
jgi:hypothetical protein